MDFSFPTQKSVEQHTEALQADQVAALRARSLRHAQAASLASAKSAINLDYQNSGSMTAAAKVDRGTKSKNEAHVNALMDTLSRRYSQGGRKSTSAQARLYQQSIQQQVNALRSQRLQAGQKGGLSDIGGRIGGGESNKSVGDECEDIESKHGSLALLKGRYYSKGTPDSAVMESLDNIQAYRQRMQQQIPGARQSQRGTIENIRQLRQMKALSTGGASQRRVAAFTATAAVHQNKAAKSSTSVASIKQSRSVAGVKATTAVSAPVSPSKSTQSTNVFQSQAMLELKQKAQQYNHSHMVRYLNQQKQQQLRQKRALSAMEQKSNQDSTAESEQSSITTIDDSAESRENQPPSNTNNANNSSSNVTSSPSMRQWYSQYSQQSNQQRLMQLQAQSGSINDNHSSASQSRKYRKDGSGSVVSMVSRASRSASIPLSQRSPVIYETSRYVGDDDDGIVSSQLGQDYEARAFMCHSTSGKDLTSSEFHAVLSQYVDADETTAYRASQFLFRYFTNNSDSMDAVQFRRSIDFIKLHVWQNLQHNFEGYYELFSFVDADRNGLVSQPEFVECFQLCAGFLRAMGRVGLPHDKTTEWTVSARGSGKWTSKVRMPSTPLTPNVRSHTDDLKIDDELLVTNFVVLIFRILDVDEDGYVEEKAFCYGFKAGMGLLLLGQRQSLSRHEEWTVEEWLEFFQVVDFNNSGEIVLDEFLFGFQILWGLNAKLKNSLMQMSEPLQKLEFWLIDRNSRGSITSETFVQQMQQLYHLERRKKLADYVFHRYFMLLDQDYTGQLSRMDINHFLACCQRCWTNNELVRNMSRYFSKKCEKYDFISREKFVKYCRNTFPELTRGQMNMCGLI